MMNSKYKNNIIATLILLVLDFLWIKLFIGNLFGNMVKEIQGSPIKLNNTYAFLAYFLMVVGLNHFVLPKINLKNITAKDCFINAFVFGIILYGVFDFTSAAIFNKWNSKTLTYDILWGGTVYFLSCYLLKFFN